MSLFEVSVLVGLDNRITAQNTKMRPGQVSKVSYLLMNPYGRYLPKNR